MSNLLSYLHLNYLAHNPMLMMSLLRLNLHFQYYLQSSKSIPRDAIVSYLLCYNEKQTDHILFFRDLKISGSSHKISHILKHIHFLSQDFRLVPSTYHSSKVFWNFWRHWL